MDPERVSYHLWNWAKWQRDDRDELPHGYPRRSLVIGRGLTNDFDGMLTAADELCAKATDAVIDALPAPQRNAVHAQHEIAAWRGEGDRLELYAQACVLVGRGLARRGVV